MTGSDVGTPAPALRNGPGVESNPEPSEQLTSNPDGAMSGCLSKKVCQF